MSEDRIVVYERDMRALLAIDMEGFSAKQIQEHVADIKGAWGRFLETAPSTASAGTPRSLP